MATNTAKRGFFRNAVDALVAAREKQANRYVHNTLLMLDDETLKAYGYKREELQRRYGGANLF